jgi:hypothetical protein
MPLNASRFARAVIPSGALELYDRVTEIDLDVVEMLRTAPVDRLRDPAYLEHELIPRLGLELAPFLPGHLEPHVGHGLRAVQAPNQLAPYLVTLAGLPIARYLEVGVMFGGTFVLTTEYLRRVGTLREAIAVDVRRPLGLLRHRAPGVRFVHMASGTPRFAEAVRRWRPDAVLIDADHAYANVRDDFAAVDGIAPVVAFHDISDQGSPGVARLWAELRAERAGDFQFAEFTAQYPDVVERRTGPVFGLGLAVRHGHGPPLETLVPAAATA